MRTSYAVTCFCGHSGKIIFSENDAPFSENWQKYTLEDLNGGPISTPAANWHEVFKAMNVTCPKCHQNLNKENLKP